MNHLQRKQLQRNQLKRNNFQWTNFCKIRNNFIWNSLGCKFGHFKIFYELIFELWGLFSVIFLDSDITGRFQCELTKTGYVAHFGFSPHFHELMSKLSDCPYISLSFDESSNSSVQFRKVKCISLFDFRTRRQTFLPHATQDRNLWVHLQLKMFYKNFLLVLVI